MKAMPEIDWVYHTQSNPEIACVNRFIVVECATQIDGVIKVGPTA